MEERNEMNPIDMLFDEENWDDITLYDDEENAVRFEQIAIIPYEEEVYAILRPRDVENIEEDEALVFLIKGDEDEDMNLEIVTDEELAGKIFFLYNTYIDEE